jgi:nicotinamide-nucleotide amidase
MKPMFSRFVVPEARRTSGRAQHQVRLRLFGLPEASVNELLSGVEQAFAGVTLGYRAHFPEIEVKALAEADDPEAAERLARAAAQVVRERLGDCIFAEGDVTLAEAVGSLMRERGYSFGTVESCTGGLVAKLITDRSASDYFVGGIVSYANRAKESLLGVSPETLAEHGAVSEQVARQMAEGGRRALGVDVALSLTGIAGPTGGTPEKPVGLVHVAAAFPDRTLSTVFVFERERDWVRLYAAYRGLDLVRRGLLNLPIIDDASWGKGRS